MQKETQHVYVLCVPLCADATQQTQVRLKDSLLHHVPEAVVLLLLLPRFILALLTWLLACSSQYLACRLSLTSSSSCHAITAGRNTSLAQQMMKELLQQQQEEGERRTVVCAHNRAEGRGTLRTNKCVHVESAIKAGGASSASVL